jgi:DNA transformation protein
VNSADFVAYVVETMRPALDATAKRMFGGHGIFDGERMFALIVDDVLYLRCGEGNRAAFDRLDLPPFEYSRAGGRRVAMSYRQAPDEALESPAEMREWVRGAVLAARAAAPGGARRRRPTNPA